MNKLLRYLFFLVLVRPVVLLLLGVNVHHRHRLPQQGPAIIIANHNSHLDTLILMNLFPYRLLPFLRPVAAADYFLRNRFLAWFSKHIIGIIPITRSRSTQNVDPLKEISQALLQKEIVIFYPEGTRGEPEQLAQFKSGIAHLASRHPDIPIFPVFLYGAGKALPKGEALLVPFVIDIQIGNPLSWSGDKHQFIEILEHVFADFADKVKQQDF
ncbi:MAG: glycerol acyltransferase [Gammaproteobacteria bacterium RIFCSPHIGHO2_12_FULL_41_15]|nr:MAG: glycerol acyltransferase [Gammaproteobacteria bacterium RIFCSPHIGHO2_12_FULL_41_15]